MHGAARVAVRGECINFQRFTEEQERQIREYNDAFYVRARTTAGITLEMDTDSRHLALSVEVCNAFRDRCFSHSVLVDGKRIGELRGMIPKNSQSVSMDAEFDLGIGYKRVQIVFPWSAESAVRFLRLDDAATVLPVCKQQKMLIFGDSITQGYDAHYPENAYAQRLTHEWNASAINKSIGGIKYYPPLAQLPDGIVPDVILISYGGNDFHGGDKAAFEQDSVLFCRSLRTLYPEAKMIVLMPLCTRARKKNEPHWYFEELQNHLRGLPAEIPNLTVIDSSDFVADDPALFYNDGVHPLDAGHDLHYQGINAALGQDKF